MKYIILINFLSICSFGLFAQPVLKISFGTDMVLNDGTDLVLQNMDLENEGIFDALSTNVTVTFSGSEDASLISEDLEFYNIKINKSSNGTIYLNTDILVENNIDMTSGILDLNGYTITLDGGQIENENQSNYITGTSGGTIEYIAILNSPDQENPGNLGIEITSVSNLGQTVIRRGHVEQTSNNGGKSIHRYFDINPVNNSGLNAILRIYYNDQELNGIPESELEPWRSTDGGNTWELMEGGLLNMTNNWVQLSGVDAFSRWTLASETTSPLPVELLYFKGKAEARYNLLEWETISEENVDHFEIQKLENQNWITWGRVEAAHFSTSLQSYSFEDIDFNHLEYYRLRILDYNGKEDFSEVIIVERSSEVTSPFIIYPNPVYSQLFLKNEINGVADNIRIFNTQGVLMIEEQGVNQIDLYNLIPGIYFLEAQFGQELYTRKFTKILE
jgi:type IX secretion system substrate protein